VPGTVKVVTASGAFTLTNGTALVLPSGANITAAAGDRFLVVALTNTNVAVFAYTRADGSAIVNPSVPIGAVLYGDWGTIPVKTVYGTAGTFPSLISRISRRRYARPNRDADRRQQHHHVNRKHGRSRCRNAA
jgi:hypothetical protein